MTKAKIMIVEDEVIICKEIESTLENLGYEVVATTDNGEAAIELAKKHKPDLILMDIRLNGDIDGIETSEIIRNRFEIPVIFSTAYLDQERIERAKITMPFGYVLKPIQESDLRVTIEMALYVSKLDAERKETEQALKGSEARLKEAQQIAQLGHWELNLKTNTLYWSDEIYRIFGLHPQQFSATYEAFLDNIHPDDRDFVHKAYTDSVNNKTTYDIVHRLLLKDGTEKYVNERCHTTYDDNGQAVRSTGTVHDNTKQVMIEVELKKYQENLEGLVKDRTAKLQAEIHERKQVEIKLNRQQAFLEAVLENIEDGIVVCNEEGKLSLFNRATRIFHGIVQKQLPPEEWATHYDLFLADGKTPMQKEDVPLFKAFQGEHIKAIEMIIAPKRGEKITVLASGQAMYDSQRKKLGAVVSMYNITERKRAEEKLRQAKEVAESANRAKSEFLSNISHELRNPMHQILSYSKYGIDKIEKPKEKLWHYFNQIRKAAERLMVLLNDLLDLSKMESGRMDYKMEPNNVFQIANEAVSALKPTIEEKNLSLKVIDPSVSTKIRCDSYKIGQVVRNLLSNAIKFTPEEKSIEITFEQNELVIGKNTLPAIQVSVCDQGIGIPENELALVFDKFTQSSKTKTGAGGTGLGLAICREIINGHKGNIWAENNPEGGATFCFTLPYEQKIA